jgi:putative membrane protein
MKKVTAALVVAATILWACNSTETKDSVETADSTNKANIDSANAGKSNQTITTDAETSSFLVHVADAGMAEVQMGKDAQSKAVNARVKAFADMMVRDHSAGNDQVKSLASQRNVVLPDSVSEDHMKMMNDLKKKTGKDFDKAYMDDMVKGHEKVVDMLEKSNDKVNDTEVKTFINNTLPKIKEHLDSAKAIRKSLK